MSRRRPLSPGSGRGFTLVELVIVVAIVGILASVALPLARWSVKRSREHELQESLRTIRLAIDRYHDAARAGLIAVPEGESGYPPSLDALVQGVPLIAEMPTPAPPVIGPYNATGAGLTGGLEAMAEAQRQSQVGGSAMPGSPGSTGAGGPGPAGDSRSPAFMRSVPSQRGTGGDGEDGDSDRFNFSFSFGDRPGSGAGGFGDDEDDAPAEPLLGLDGKPRMLTFLRRLPVDPMTGEANWGLRCYGEPPDDRLWCGTDVFDVYSRSLAKAIDGTDYRDW